MVTIKRVAVSAYANDNFWYLGTKFWRLKKLPLRLKGGVRVNTEKSRLLT
jgi:hypothetical protein